MAIRLAQNGYVAATVSYRLAPMFQFPLPLHDVKSAVRFLRANADKYSIDGAKMGAIGVSAGATFAQFLAVSRNIPSLEGNGPSRINQAASIVPSASTAAPICAAPTRKPPPLTSRHWRRRQRLDAHFRASPLSWVNPDSALSGDSRDQGPEHPV
jgi:acetyl esterase/lipase